MTTPKREKEKMTIFVLFCFFPIFSPSFPEPGCLVPSLSLDIDRQTDRYLNIKLTFKYFLLELF